MPDHDEPSRVIPFVDQNKEKVQEHPETEVQKTLGLNEVLIDILEVYPIHRLKLIFIQSQVSRL